MIPDCRPRWSVLSVVLTSLLVASCSGDAVARISPDSPPPETAQPTLAISADLFNGSVSFLDLDALVAPDGTRDGALVERVQLTPPDQQGPLTVAVTAVVKWILRSDRRSPTPGSPGHTTPTAQSDHQIASWAS